MRHFLFFLGLFFCLSTAHAQRVELEVGGEDDLDACAENLKVIELDPTPGNGLNVREGPGLQYMITDLLMSGQSVLGCDYRFGPDWLGVVYKKGRKIDCKLGFPRAMRGRYNGPCDHGWVSRKFLK